jgi:hypothetical protein
MEKQQDQKFYKFPKTPHLAGSSTVDDDQILSKTELRAFASNSHVVIQEKVDGNFDKRFLCFSAHASFMFCASSTTRKNRF